VTGRSYVKWTNSNNVDFVAILQISLSM